MMNHEQLKAIKERVAKASHGPWMVIENEFVHSISSVIAAVSKITDVDFITHAREDVPALVTEVERLLKLLDIEERNSSDHLKASTGLFKKVEILNSENSKFRKALEEIMEDQAPIMEGWETTTYEIARKALGGEAK